MIPVWGGGEFHEEVEVYGGADCLQPAQAEDNILRLTSSKIVIYLWSLLWVFGRAVRMNKFFHDRKNARRILLNRIAEIDMLTDDEIEEEAKNHQSASDAILALSRSTAVERVFNQIVLETEES